MKRLLLAQALGIGTVVCIILLFRFILSESGIQRILAMGFTTTAIAAAVGIAGAAIITGLATRSGVDGMVRSADANAIGVATAAMVAGFTLSVAAGFVVSIAAGFAVHLAAGLLVTIAAGVVIVGVAIAAFLVIRAAHVAVAGIVIGSITLAIVVASCAGAVAVLVQATRQGMLTETLTARIVLGIAGLSTALTALIGGLALRAAISAYETGPPLPRQIILTMLTAALNVMLLYVAA